MRKEDRAAAGLRVDALQDVLEEGVIGPTLWRRAEEVPAPWIGAPCLSIPLLDGVRGVGEDHVEGPQLIPLQELRLRERVAALDVKVVDSVEEQVHSGN